MPNTKPVLIKIKRQLTPDAKPSWEEFEIPYKPNMNVTSALMEIAHPQINGKKQAIISKGRDHRTAPMPGTFVGK